VDAINTEQFDYRAPAELFALKRKKFGPVTYHRFDTAAEAIRYAIENLSRPLLPGSYIETGAVRLNGRMIQQLYGAPDYPLRGRPS
jgi:hypothetical protein